MTEVSDTRLYLGHLPRDATRADIEAHFASHGTGEITDVKVMNGFGFIEYKDPMDAQDIVPAFHGTELKGERLTVQFARGPRHTLANPERTQPRPRRTAYRMQISGLPGETSWQDQKDFARLSSLDVVYSETHKDRDGKGFVEFNTAADLRNAVELLNQREYKGARVTCTADIQEERPRSERYRSRSPPPSRRGANYPPPPAPPSDYDRRRGSYHSPSRHGYRDRSPRRDDYYGDPRGYRSPPRGPPRGGPPDDYRRPPPYDERYDMRGPPPRGGGYPPADPYMNGHARGYGRPPSPRGGRRSPGPGYYDYDRRPAHW